MRKTTKTTNLVLIEQMDYDFSSERFVMEWEISINSTSILLKQDDIDLLLEHSSIFEKLEKRVIALENPGCGQDED